MASSPITDNTDLVSFDIRIQGTQISSTIEVNSIHVVQNEDGNASAELTILLNNDITDGLGSQYDDFKVDNGLEILLGYHGQNKSVFKGKITTQSIGIDEELGCVLNVECYESNPRKDIPTTSVASLKLTFGVDLIDVVLNQYETDSENVEIIGSALFQGSSKVVPGNTVELSGFTNAFNGNQLVVRVEHLVSEGQWTTEIDI